MSYQSPYSTWHYLHALVKTNHRCHHFINFTYDLCICTGHACQLAAAHGVEDHHLAACPLAHAVLISANKELLAVTNLLYQLYHNALEVAADKVSSLLWRIFCYDSLFCRPSSMCPHHNTYSFHWSTYCRHHGGHYRRRHRWFIRTRTDSSSRRFRSLVPVLPSTGTGRINNETKRCFQLYRRETVRH